MTSSLRLALSAVFVAGAVAAGAAPAFAGAVYVPFAANSAINGLSANTTLTVSNPDAASGRYEPHFIPAGQDGTTRTATPASILVTAGKSVSQDSLVPAGGLGMLEVNLTATKLAADAVLEFGAGSLLKLPVISSSNLIAANQTLHLQGVERQNGESALRIVTSLGLANLDKTASSTCTVSAFASNGSALGTAQTISVPKLSFIQSADVAGAFGATDISSARLQVSCTKAFYAALLISNVDTQTFVLVGPAGSGKSTLGSTPPGDDDDDGDGFDPAFPTRVLYKPTAFHTPTTAKPSWTFHVTRVPSGTKLNQAVVEVGVHHAGYNTQKPDGLHGVFLLQRGPFDGKWGGNVVGYLNARGPSNSLVSSFTNLDLPGSDKVRKELPLVMKAGKLYEFRWSIDTPTHTSGLVVKENGAAIVRSFFDVPINSPFVANADGFNVQIGLADGGSAGPETVSSGWTYENLKIYLVPK